MTDQIKKLNAIYGFKGYGSKGLKEEITKLLDIPISYYVKVDYKDAENVIDVLGGVEITVAKHMVYDDPLNTPPLHIDIPAGKQVLSGENAIKYLRWRQDNDMVGDGDLGRIQRQQKFMVAAIRKALSFRLPVVAKTAFQYIKTDMTLNTTIYYASLAIEFDFKNIKTYQLPGTQAYMEGGCFVVSDTVQTTELMESIYNRVPSQGL